MWIDVPIYIHTPVCVFARVYGECWGFPVASAGELKCGGVCERESLGCNCFSDLYRATTLGCWGRLSPYENNHALLTGLRIMSGSRLNLKD